MTTIPKIPPHLSQANADTNGVPPDARTASADDVLGMAWWNNLSEHQRARALWAAQTAVPAEAWQHWRRTTVAPELVEALLALTYACESPELNRKARSALATVGL